MRVRSLLGAVLAAAVLGAGCTDDDPFDRAATVATVAEVQGWSEQEAGCWVDRVRDELGDEELARALEAPVTDAVYADITVDCVDPSKLSTSPELQTTITADPTEPFTRGDDPELDVLWDGCAAGDGAACDALFDAAPLGSEYERFASTCGDRGYRAVCADEPAAP